MKRPYKAIISGYSCVGDFKKRTEQVRTFSTLRKAQTYAFTAACEGPIGTTVLIRFVHDDPNHVQHLMRVEREKGRRIIASLDWIGE